MKKWVISFLLAAPCTYALPTDRDQPLNATSNQASFDQNNLIAVYQGNVHATQGTTSLSSNTLTLKLNNARQLQSAIAEGSPAIYTTTLKPKEVPLVAKAQHLEYLPQQHQIILRGDGFVTHGDDSYRSSLIYYDTDSQTVLSPKLPGNRVRIVIQPQEKHS
ncbi:MAG: lptA [Gammaproteobacteria bacterium]|jgi:lipopolysaccharide export system protein LptA|nr:lptA [Gammaproteobacteria bacterium]